MKQLADYEMPSVFEPVSDSYRNGYYDALDGQFTPPADRLAHDAYCYGASIGNMVMLSEDVA